MIVLDTHIWVNWILCGEAALTPAIVNAMQQEGRLTVSAISCFEVSLLVSRGKLELPLPVDEWLKEALGKSGVESLPVNRAYALAKIAGIEMCWSYNREYGTKWLAAMPTNLYGPGDNYDLNNSHVLPALIRKMHEAKIADAKEVVLWSGGTPKREFLYVDDLANALVFLAALDDTRYDALVEPSHCPLINVGSGEDLTIRELAETIAEVVGYQGGFVQDTSKPDGTMRKLMDVSKIRTLGWEPGADLRKGAALAYKDYLLSFT